MDVPAYEIIFCISKTQYSLCRQHKCPLFHDIVFYAHYTSFAMRCQHNSTLFLLLWLVFLVDFCGFSLFLLRYQVKQKAFSDFHILISENAFQIISSHKLYRGSVSCFERYQFIWNIYVFFPSAPSWYFQHVQQQEIQIPLQLLFCCHLATSSLHPSCFLHMQFLIWVSNLFSD